ncbi:MAG: hypothetical protein PHV03_00485 [Desulfitobacteriaceae bacterium]|nr:hypothetical protein [Desulfitobacteriaceae bacterium]
MDEKRGGIMILATIATVATQCPNCGEMEFQALSLFAFSKPGHESFACHCSTPLLKVSNHKRRQFSLFYQCTFCGETHHICLSRRAIWGKEALPLICPEVKAIAGFVGPKQKVVQACQEREKSIGELADELGYEEEFENPEAMLRLLDHLRYLAKEDKLGCRCGNRQLAFELLPDRIELYCELCEALGVIYADNLEKIWQVESMSSLYLEENNTWLVNHICRQQLAMINKEE